jgi:hypothetical protein
MENARHSASHTASLRKLTDIADVSIGLNHQLGYWEWQDEGGRVLHWQTNCSFRSKHNKVGLLCESSLFETHSFHITLLEAAVQNLTEKGKNSRTTCTLWQTPWNILSPQNAYFHFSCSLYYPYTFCVRKYKGKILANGFDAQLDSQRIAWEASRTSALSQGSAVTDHLLVVIFY